MMTKQQIFDHVATFLLKQGRAAYDNTAGCLYRTEDGRKCAIGCLIPDDVFDAFNLDALNEGTGLDKLVDKRPGLFQELGIDLVDNANLLDVLQNAHDTRLGKDPDGDLSDFIEEMQSIANDFDLVPSALNV